MTSTMTAFYRRLVGEVAVTGRLLRPRYTAGSKQFVRNVVRLLQRCSSGESPAGLAHIRRHGFRASGIPGILDSGGIDAQAEKSLKHRNPATIHGVETSLDGRHLTVSLSDENTMRLNATWLRHNCQCDICRQKSSGQKLIRPAQLAASYTVSSAHIDVDGQVLRVSWTQEESHESEFPVEFLRHTRHTPPDRRRAMTSPSGGVGRLPSVAFADVLQQDGLLRWLQLLNEVGVCLVRGVPTDDGNVRRVAELICPIQNTIYGLTWNVVSEPRPINVAYSDAELDFHMDLAYYESPPGIQFLHCVQFDECVQGGESLFVDAWLVAEAMRVSHPEEFDVLTRVPATFQKVHFDRDRPVLMRYRHPHITVEPEGGQIVGIRWAPAFEGPLDVEEADIEPYYRAYSTFARLLDSSPTRLETRLVPGDLVCFNNRRVLHARHGFQLNGGMRRLQGCYINIDEYTSRLQVETARRSEDQLTVKNVFNYSWL